ncbi:biotin transport system substrate-specific component [Aeromicrobium sp. SORGH_AS981]|uniref:biotin transporter BioY n=1 Tax=Aeromicrobium sp. SORGH_AS_0981 TaxID=3041802 RepID=UPI0028660B44|nr:biotin transporter BioY [Aeromicrobium sp. SORGH_AS_0981]MDR6117167.1 biotin transport system substrate-specific component [Aeromicrobium sp. SORGH_AS_0981]
MSSTTTARRRGLTTTDLALVAVFAALVAVCSVVAALPFGVNGVPVTLQLFGVFLAGAVLGPVRGFLAVALYLAVGAVGVPVFAGPVGGLAPFAGPTAGYLVSFPLVALVVGLAVQRARAAGLAVTTAVVLVGGLVGEVVCWLVGALGIALYSDTPYLPTVKATAVYVPADLVKLVLAAVVAAAVHRAFPQLLTRR